MDVPDLSSFVLTGVEGRAVAVTGGASGIGRASAILAAQSGATVVVGDVNAPALAELAELAATHDLAIRCLRLNLADAGSIEDFLTDADRDSRLYGVVNAAGIAAATPALELSLETWKLYQDVMLTGPFLMAQGAARRIVARGGIGSIINVSSAAGIFGAAGLSHYTAAKAGLIGLTKALAREWGPQGIRVNTVSPGAVDTPLYRAQTTKRDVISALSVPRVGTPDDLALAIGFFLGNQSPWITGQNLVVNGGSLMH